MPEGLGDAVTAEGHKHVVELQPGHPPGDGIFYPFQTEGLERRRPGWLAVLRSGPIAGDGAVTAIMPGLIIRVRLEPGQKVAAGDPPAVLEVMKTERDLCSPRDGVVTTGRTVR